MGMKFQIDDACWLGDDGWFHRGTIRIANGRIAKLESDFAADAPCGDEIVVPGLIDAHVHLREPGQAYKEGIANGTAAALKGGVATVLDMPNNRPPIATRESFEMKRAIFAHKARVNYGLFWQATDGGEPAPETAAGAKIYMAQSSSLPAIGDADALARIFRVQDLVVVHAEDERRFFHNVENSRVPSPSRQAQGEREVYSAAAWRGERGSVSDRSGNSFPQCGKLSHHLRRPRAAIMAALASLEIALRKTPAKARPRLVVAHCSTVEELAWVRKMKRAGHDVWAETCPHYFLLTEEDYLRHGAALQVNPPLRSAEDRAAIYEAVKNGGIDFVSTDHAPHAPAEKAGKNPPSGIAGIEWLGPILLTLAKRGEISWKRYLELSGQNAARCFGIEGRGGIREGAWADLAFVALGQLAKNAREKVATRAGFRPYAEFDFAARVRAMIINGQTAWSDGHVRPGVRGREVFA